MAFDISKLDVGRANFNCDATIFNSVIHTYTTPDLLSMVKSVGYFPDYLGQDNDAVKIGDILQVNSFSTGDAIQNELSFNFAIATVSPLVIVQLDQLLYNSYTMTYSGAATGFLTVGFSRDPSGLVNMQIITVTSFSITVAGFVTCAFTVPSVYLPDPTTYGASGVTNAVTTMNGANPLVIDININSTANAGIKFSRTPNVALPVSSLPIHNYSVSYLGQPI